MPGITTPESGNTALSQLMKITLSPAQVAANTTAEQTFAVNGVQTNDLVLVNKPSAQAGLGIVGSRVSAANTIGITFVNATAAPITPTASEGYLIFVIRADGANIPNFPTSIS